MKTIQDYDFQRISSKRNDKWNISLKDNSNCISNQTNAFIAYNNSNSCSNINLPPNKTINELKLNSLEKRIEALEKRLHYYEELLTIKNNELAKYQSDSSLIKDSFKRITQLEESFHQYTLNNYSLKQIDAENLISEKLNPLQININKKLNDITIMMQDLSQFNTTQQRQFLNFKEALSSLDETVNGNSVKIKEMNKQFLSILNMFNDNSNEDEELFLKNICKK